MVQETPEWLRSEKLEMDYVPLNSKVIADGAETNNSQVANNPRAKLVQWGFRILTMGLCLLMALTSMIGLGEWHLSNNFATKQNNFLMTDWLI